MLSVDQFVVSPKDFFEGGRVNTNFCKRLQRKVRTKFSYDGDKRQPFDGFDIVKGRINWSTVPKI